VQQFFIHNVRIGLVTERSVVCSDMVSVFQTRNTTARKHGHNSALLFTSKMNVSVSSKKPYSCKSKKHYKQNVAKSKRLKTKSFQRSIIVGNSRTQCK
jgi:hypothetical protein